MADDQPSIARQLFEAARKASLGEEPRPSPSADQLVAIAGDAAAQLELIRLVREQNDPHFRDLLVLVFEQAADALEELGGEIDDGVDLLDRAGLAPTAAVSAGAIAAIVASGGAALPLLVLAAGAVGMGGLGVGRTWLKSKSRRQKADAKKVRALSAKLGAAK